MSDNLPDFLNDNAGVVTGLAGAAVHRNITATNRNLTALRGELGKLQERFAQEKEKEAKESLNRDMLFQINQQVESIASADASPDQYFELIRVSEDLESLGFTSATFNSLQDKSYLASVSSSIDHALGRCLESLPEETKSMITAAVAWKSLRSLSSSIAQVDESIAGLQRSIIEARRWLGVLEKTEPHYWSSNKIMTMGISGAVIGVILGLMAITISPVFTILALVVPAAAAMASVALLANSKSKSTKQFADVNEANRRVLHAEDHIKRSRTKRSALVQQLSDLKEIPPETIQYYGSEAVDHSERLNQLKDISEYLNQVRHALNIDRGKLDTDESPDIAVDHQFGHDGECRRCGFTKQAVDRFGIACEPG